MRAASIFLIVCATLGLAVLIGIKQEPSVAPKRRDDVEDGVPNIGRIQVLNGCGITGAAGATAGFFRARRFDVKNIGNAATWNYPYTMVISRTSDMNVARQIADALGTDKLMLLRNGEEMYDVTVVLGADFAELIE